MTEDLNAQSLNVESLLPHRAPMLLLDTISLEGDLARGEKTIRADEFFVQGHFPGHPVVPGVILCEILAQSACALMQIDAEGSKRPMFTGLDQVRFRHPVVPGDCFRTEVKLTKHKGPFYWAEGQGFVKDRLCVEAKFSFALV